MDGALALGLPQHLRKVDEAIFSGRVRAVDIGSAAKAVSSLTHSKLYASMDTNSWLDGGSL